MIELVMAVTMIAGQPKVRDPEKCGLAIVRLAERVGDRGGQIRVPMSCLGEIRFPETVDVKQGPHGIELWRHGQRWVRFLPASQVQEAKPAPKAGVEDKMREAGMAVYDIPR